jgi:hypothetical protein
MDPATTSKARDLPVTTKTEEGLRILFSKKSKSKLPSAGLAGNNPPANGVVLRDPERFDPMHSLLQTE